MCKLHNELLRIRAEQDLTNDDIAQRMASLLGTPVGHDSVAKYFGGQEAGVPLKKLEAFLAAFGLKVVEKESVCISRRQYEAMMVFTEEGVQALKEGGQ